MSERSPGPGRVSLELTPTARLGVALGALLLVGVLAVLIAVLVSLEGSRSEIRTTRLGVTQAEERSERLAEQVRPLLEAAAPLVTDASQRELRRTGRDLSEAAGQVSPLAEDARRGVGVATFIAQVLHGAELGPSLGAVRSLADAALPATLRLVPAAAGLSAELDRTASSSTASCDRQLRSAAPSARGQVACLIRTAPDIRALLRSQRDINARTLATQTDTLSYTRRIHALFVQSVAIQREVLARTKSLDDKTGGPAPLRPSNPR